MSGKYSDIVDKTEKILAERNDNGFLTRKTINSDGAELEKYSLSDIANFMHSMKKLDAAEKMEENANSIYKPIRMVHAL